jgi:hypothetical protein
VSVLQKQQLLLPLLPLPHPQLCLLLVPLQLLLVSQQHQQAAQHMAAPDQVLSHPICPLAAWSGSTFNAQTCPTPPATGAAAAIAQLAATEVALDVVPCHIILAIRSSMTAPPIRSRKTVPPINLPH